jgi:16S rRNA (adenine1518-N6/adenine1519-N6)-dimethyltransferase
VPKVTAIEMDRRCLPALAELGEAFPGKLTVDRRRCAEDRSRTLMQGEPFHVVANLPYNVGTALLVAGSGEESPQWPPQWTSLTLMFQLEVAERIVAEPDTTAFGRLAVLAQWRTEASWR